jgi:fermentation-respiration switch protein FrsA (DUF1100 family)
VAIGLILLLAVLAGLIWVFSTRMIARRTPDASTSPADHDLAFEDVSFPARDGTGLGGWFIPTPRADRAVIFCHGHAGSMDPDVQYAPWFHQAGFNVLMFDFRAHGRSAGERVSFGALERQDLQGALDYLAQRGIERVGVLGFSMGGAVALLTAGQDERIAAVVSDGGFARLEDTVVGWARHLKGLPTWLARILAGAVRTVAGWRLGVSLRGIDPVDWIGRIAPRPVLLVHGDRDPYVSVAGVEALYAAAGEPKELWRVAEAEHREIDRLRPEEYRRKVVGFFERNLA